MATQPIIRGDDYVLKIVVTEADGALINIAGDTMYFTVKVNKSDTDAEAVFQAIDLVPSSPDADVGIHRIQMPNALAVGVLNFDVQWKRDASGTGNIITLRIDTFSVAQDVTILPQTPAQAAVLRR